MEAPMPIRKWSQHVIEQSDVLDLKRGIFNQRSPKKIASSLKHSADASHRRESSPFHSAMSMLNFYVNRAGKQLSRNQRATLEKAKDELRKDYGRESKH
jgi:hypothetical protein